MAPAASLVVNRPTTSNTRRFVEPTGPQRERGSHLFEQLPPGTYSLARIATGFSLSAHSNIVITPGLTATINLRMQIGTAEQSVVVTADAPVADTANNTTATTFADALLQGILSGGVSSVNRMIEGTQTRKTDHASIARTASNARR